MLDGRKAKCGAEGREIGVAGLSMVRIDDFVFVMCAHGKVRLASRAVQLNEAINPFPRVGEAIVKNGYVGRT